MLINPHLWPISALIRIALEASQEVVEGKTMTGKILSGDQFVADRDAVKALHEELNGDCTEMEGAAVAHVCDMNEVPFVIIRSMSDKADGSAHINFPEFTVLASNRSYKMVSLMLQRMGEEGPEGVLGDKKVIKPLIAR